MIYSIAIHGLYLGFHYGLSINIRTRKKDDNNVKCLIRVPIMHCLKFKIHYDHPVVISSTLIAYNNN